MNDSKLKLTQELKKKCGIDCVITEDGDRLFVEYLDGCATSEVKAIANELGLTVVVDRSFSEEKFTDFAVDFSSDLDIPIVDIRFKKMADNKYKIIIPENDSGLKLLSVI